MIFIDTSVWIDYLRGGNAELTTAVQTLLDDDDVALAEPVRLEVLSGCSARNLSQIKRCLSALPLFYPSASTWRTIENWIEEAVSRGQRFGLGDLLIAAIASEQNGPIWSLDKDFSRLRALKFIETWKPS